MKQSYQALWCAYHQSSITKIEKSSIFKKYHIDIKASPYLFGGVLAAFLISDAVAAEYDHTGVITTTITAQNGDIHNVLGGATVTPPLNNTGIFVNAGGTANINNVSNTLPVTITTNGASAILINSGGFATIGNVGTDATITATLTGTNAIPVGVIRASGASSELNIQNTKINANGDYNHAIYTSNGIQVAITGGTILTTGNNSHGVYARSASQITVTGTQVSGSGTGSRGLHSQDTNAKITAHSVNVNMASDNAYGAFAFGGGSIALDQNSFLETHGSSGHGLVANGGSVTAKDITVSTYGNEARGVHVVAAGHTTLEDNVKILTHGVSGYGLFASNANSSISSKNTSVNTEKANAYGVYADTGGVVDLQGGNHIVTQGDDAYGLLASGLGGLLTSSGTNNTVETLGAGAHGVMVRNRSTSTLSGTSVRTSGLGAHAIEARTLGDLTFNLTSGYLIATQGISFFSDGGVITATLDGTQVINSGVLIDSRINGVTNGSVSLVAKNLTLNGTVIADATSTANLTLTGATWNGVANNGTHFDIGSGSLWNMTAVSDIATLRNEGTIAFSVPSGGVFKTLTVHGDYHGDHGTVILNTQLDADNASTDKLIVEGDTSGSTNLTVRNAGGAGAQTLADGIMVVQVDGSSDGVFVQKGRTVGGAYEYFLHKGTVANASDGNWYLRSEYITPSPLNPILRPETGAWLGNQMAAQSLFVQTLRDRFGEASSSTDRQRSALWMRTVGSKTENQAGGQLDLDTDMNVVQIGGDVLSLATADHHWYAGLMASYGQARVDAHSKITNYSADGKVDGYSVGAYATWYGQPDESKGPYVDVWAQYGWFDNEVKGQEFTASSYKSNTLTGSVEAGWRLPLFLQQNQHLYLEPQAQVILTRYDADNYVDSTNTSIQARDSGEITTRLGLRLTGLYQFTGYRVLPFLETNWWNGGRDNSVAFDDQVVDNGVPSSHYEAKLGAQVEIGENWSIWGHLGAQAGSDSYSRLEGMLGMKYLW